MIEAESMLQLRVARPSEMIEVWKLHNLWWLKQNGNNVAKHHPNLGGFERGLQNMRSECTDSVYGI